MTRQILLIESRLAVSQPVKARLKLNGYVCTQILGPAQAQIVLNNLSALNENGQPVNVNLPDFPVAILSLEVSESQSGQNLIRVLQKTGVTCIGFDFRSQPLDLEAFDLFLREDLPKIYSLSARSERWLGRNVKRGLRFIWRGFEWLIRD